MREYLVDYKEVLNYLHSSYKGISEEEAYYEAVLIYKDVYEKNKEQK